MIDDFIPLSRFRVVSQVNGFVNQQIFDDWFSNFLFESYVKKNQASLQPPSIINHGWLPPTHKFT